MEIEIKEQEGALKAYFKGSLDTPASVKAQKDIEPILQNANKEITIDCSELNYISSSGLRLFLTIRKESSRKGGTVIIENVSDDIRKIFLMTGFSKLFIIK